MTTTNDDDNVDEFFGNDQIIITTTTDFVNDGRHRNRNDNCTEQPNNNNNGNNNGNSNGNNDDYGLLEQAETRSIQEQFRSVGFHEAYDEMSVVRVQEGFERGYGAHFDVAMTLGHVLGEVTSSLLTLLVEDEDEEDEDNGHGNDDDDDHLTDNDNNNNKKKTEHSNNVKRIVCSVRRFLIDLDGSEEQDEEEEADVSSLRTQESLSKLTEQLKELRV